MLQHDKLPTQDIPQLSGNGIPDISNLTGSLEGAQAMLDGAPTPQDMLGGASTLGNAAANQMLPPQNGPTDTGTGTGTGGPSGPQTTATPDSTAAPTPTPDSTGVGDQAIEGGTLETGALEGGDTTAVTPGTDANATDGENGPSEEEINDEISTAQANGNAQGENTEANLAGTGEQGEGEGTGTAEGNGEQTTEEGTGGPGGGQATGPGGGAGGGGGGMCLAPWEMVKGGFPWDQEIAQHDVFAGGSSGQMGQELAAALSQPPSRGEMVTNALAGGAWQGLQSGLVSVAIDTLINVASSKIPYLSGFVEIGRVLYDPAGWLESTGKNLLGGGKIGSGLEKLGSGNVLDMIEGVLDIGDGITTIIGTLSSICWIIAGLGFILSWIPGMQWLIPFVALAAQWGSLLGTIGTILGLGLSVLRGVVIGLRVLDILYWESDPAKAQEKAQGLQAQTSKFVEQWTERAGDSARSRVAGGRSHQPDSDGGGGAPRSAPPKADPPPVWSRALGIMTGSLGGERGSAIGSGFNGALGSKNVRDQWDATVNTAGATRDTFRGRQTTGQRINGLESRGIDVYVNQTQRDYTNDQLQKRGDQDPAVGLAQARDRINGANDRYRKAREDSDASGDRVNKARSDLEHANAELNAARAQHGDTISKAETELNFRRELARSYEGDVNASRAQLSQAQEMLAIAKNVNDTHPSDQSRRNLEYAQGQVDAARGRLTDAETGLTEARALVTDGQNDLALARKPVDDAQSAVTTAQSSVTDATVEHRNNESARREAGADRKDANRDYHSYDRAARDGDKNFQDRMANMANYQGHWDLSGSGMDGGHLYGQNQGMGKTGFATGLINDITADQTQSAPGAGDGMSLGQLVFSEVGEAIGGPAEPEVDHKALIMGKMDEIAGALPAPPLHVPDTVDGAAFAVEDIGAEEAAIQAELQTIGEAESLGQTQLTEAAGAHALVEANQTGVDALNTEADGLMDKQTELNTKGGEVSTEGGQGAAKGQEASGRMGFMGRLMELLSKVPSRFVSNAGAGMSGARQLDKADDSTIDAANQGKAAGDAATAAAGEFTAQTNEVKATAASSEGQLTGLDENISQTETSTNEGLTDLQQARADAEAELANLAAERERLTGVHGAAIAEGAGWANGHQATRVAKLAELDALVQAAEKDMAGT
ncbi:MAG: hypothetical protein H6739_07505 [Alphaproteobacteria bacterium]|nr:hypothetical protein [Alphaproteobacteria bacterium]